MRPFLLFLVAIVGIFSAHAAPRPVPPSGGENPKQMQAEARRFAQQLGMVVDRIVENYVRPVRREDLLEAALSALYQTAGKPIPRDLRAQIRDAVALSATLSAEQPEPGTKVVTTSATRRGDPVDRLLVRLRVQIGCPEALADVDCLVVACRGVAKKLDAYSGIVTSEEQRRAVNLDQEAIGVGLECQEQLVPGPFVIDVVQPGGPAQRAGLRPGDVITHIDGAPAGKAAPASVLALRSQQTSDGVVPLARPDKPGDARADAIEIPSKVHILYRRPGETKKREAVLFRDRFRPETIQGVRREENNAWDYIVDARANIAHIRIKNLSRGTSDELRAALVMLRENKCKGMILDLRWCPGGYLNEAVEVADLFLGEAVVATIKSRNKQDTVYRSTSQGKFRDFPLVVLVNAATSGGAELIAAALQDHHRALIVGQRTLGKASVQTPISIGITGTGFKLTSGTFVRPSGKNLHRFPEDTTASVWGVIPDHDARLSPELGRRLQDWWQTLSLRPASSMERLPLDDPRADPQQQAALDVMRKKIR